MRWFKMGVYAPEDYVIYIALLLVIMWLLRKYFFPRIRIDKEFVYAIAPYMLFGIFIRVLVDVKVFPADQLWSITPGVYVLTIILALAGIAVGRLVGRRLRIQYWRISFLIGILLLMPLAYELLLHLINPERIFYPLLMASAIVLLVYLLSKPLKLPVYSKPENIAIIFAHLLDGCATFIAINYFGFYEEHLLPIYMIGLAGNDAFIMVPAKLVLILVVVYFVDKWQKEEAGADETLYRAIKILLFILGIGPGIRDMLLPALF
jgi:uncharacterized membrane protein